MHETPLVYGARASLLLSYDGPIEALAGTLSSGLKTPPFDIEAREDPPYDPVGSLEVLGTELWLESSGRTDYQYELRAETQHCLEESFTDQMHDLSLWLARYVSTICGIDTLVHENEGEARFDDGELRLDE